MKAAKTVVALAAVGVLGAWFAVAPTAQPARSGALTIEQLVDIRHPSAPMWSPDGRSVVFVWDRAGVSRVYVADASGGATPRELRDAGSLAGAFWSSDGKALMVARSGDLWRVPIDGSAASAVWTTTAAEQGIVASPDGARVAFVRSAATSGPPPTAGRGGGRGGRGGGGSGDLVVRSLADGRETVVRHDVRPIGGLTWSPDGQTLVYNDVNAPLRHEQTPDYSGTKIIYTITENVPGQTYAIAVGNGQGTSNGQSAGEPKPLGMLGGFGGRRWLDARHFVVDRTSTDFKRRTTSLVDVTGGEPKVLHEDVKEKFWSITGDANAGAQPSPDGKWIAFLSDHDGWDHLYVMPSAGGAPVQVTHGKFAGVLIFEFEKKLTRPGLELRCLH